jgi:hypothetical protein
MPTIAALTRTLCPERPRIVNCCAMREKATEETSGQGSLTVRPHGESTSMPWLLNSTRRRASFNRQTPAPAHTTTNPRAIQLSPGSGNLSNKGQCHTIAKKAAPTIE